MLFVVALAFVILWINSRGEFVFLDAVVNGRREIVAPWHAWREQGNSLFVWRIVFGLIVFAGFATLSGIVVLLALGGRIPSSIDDVPWLRVLGAFGIVWLPFVVAGLYVHLFVRHFITAIMFRDRVTTTEAWRTFLPLLRQRMGAFLLYGLFVLALHIGLFLALIPAICLTCCLLGCLMAIPFVGAVVWLPVSYSFRAYGPEFLAQFGAAYDLWPVPAAAIEAAPEPPPEPPPEISG